MGQRIGRLGDAQGEAKMTNVVRRIKYLETFQAKGTLYAFLKRRPGRRFPGLLKAERIPLPTPVGSPEFWTAYHQAIKGETVAPVMAARAHGASLRTAIEQYLEGEGFAARVPSPAARARQASTLRKWTRAEGDLPIARVDRAYVDRLLGSIDLPNPKYTMLITIKQLFVWCVSKGMMPADPTSGIKLKPAKSDGRHTWTEEQIAQFEAHWQLGTLERLVFDLLLYTGQRGSDARRLGPQHIRDGEITIKQQKTGVEVCCPLHPALAASIAAGPAGHLTFLQLNGRPLLQGRYNELFRAACDAAGLPDICMPHGLRKAFCTRLADLGVSTHDIAALSGHLSLREVERYTKKYNRRTGGRRAMATLIASGGAA
jgi:integrase